MPERIATVLGATGLIGRHLLAVLQQDDTFSTVRAVVRRPERFPQMKTEMKLVSFEEPESVKMAIDGSDAVFLRHWDHAKKKVRGDKTSYRRIDYDIPVMAARFCAETQCPQFLLVSAVGANPGSSNFYLQVKGQVEEGVQKYRVPSISLFRPSILLGDRAESRPGEKLAQAAAGFFSFMLLGSWEKYRGIEASKVARAMVQAAKEKRPGVTVYEYPEMQLLLKRFGR